MNHPHHPRLVLWALGAVFVNPSSLAAAAEGELDVDDDAGMTIEIDLLSPTDVPTDICYRRPANWHPKLEAHFREVFEAAARSTRPDRATSSPRFSESLDAESCAHQLSMTLEDGRKGEPRNLTVQLVEAGTVLLETTIGPLVPYRSTSDQFEPAWRELWAKLAPEPAPPAPEPEDEAFVDDDLMQARASLEEEEERDRAGPWVTALALGGLTTRSVDVEPAVGRAQDIDALVSAGARIDLHFARWLGWRGHRLDGRAEYWHQFASADVDGRSIETNADRIRGQLAYGRQWFGPRAPEIAVSAGFEYRRFTFAEAANTVSSEVSAFRPGLTLEQPLLGGEGAALALFAGGRVRLPVSSSSGRSEFDVGFDADAGLRFSHPVGFVAELGAEYTRQSATLAPVSFAEDYFDVLLGIGWSL
jgi:hypothetical protein